MKNFFKNKDIIDFSLIIVLILVFGLSAKIIYKKINNKNKKESVKLETFSIKNIRKKDYGFKFKIDDCFTLENREDFIVIDIDFKNTYILAKADQYFNGPFPITEKTLVKEPALMLDKKSSKLISCEELSKKFGK